MNVEISFTVSTADFSRIDVVEPIVGHHFTGNIQDQTAQGVALIGVGVNAPVKLLKVLIDRRFNIHPTLSGITGLLTLFTIDNIGAKRFEKTFLKKGALHSVLHLLNMRRD